MVILLPETERGRRASLKPVDTGVSSSTRSILFDGPGTKSWILDDSHLVDQFQYLFRHSRVTIIREMMEIFGEVGNKVDKVSGLFGTGQIDDISTKFLRHDVNNVLILSLDFVPVPLDSAINGTEEGVLEVLGIQVQILVHLAIPILDNDVLGWTPLFGPLPDFLGGGTRSTTDGRVDETRMPVANEEKEGIRISRSETTCQLAQTGAIFVGGPSDLLQHYDIVDGLVAVFIVLTVLVDLALVIGSDQALQTHRREVGTGRPHSQILGIGRQDLGIGIGESIADQTSSPGHAGSKG